MNNKKESENTEEATRSSRIWEKDKDVEDETGGRRGKKIQQKVKERKHED